MPTLSSFDIRNEIKSIEDECQEVYEEYNNSGILRKIMLSLKIYKLENKIYKLKIMLPKENSNVKK